jgi:hypothetical protein
MPSHFRQPGSSGGPRFIPGVFGLASLGIGLTVLGFLWLTPFDEFDSPPLFFRIFGSFIAIVFVAVGSAGVWGAIRGTNPLGPTRPREFSPRQMTIPSPARGTYTCPHCAAPLGSNIDVSPLGDVKCPFCHAWFNIHAQAAS